MAGGSNAVAVKSALIDVVTDLPLEVQVSYGMPANLERACVYGGRVRGTTTPMAMRAGGPLPRDERLQINLHVAVLLPSATILEAEQQAVDIATAIIDAVAAAPTLNDLPGLLLIQLTDMQMDSGADDDAASAMLTLTFAARSHLT